MITPRDYTLTPTAVPPLTTLADVKTFAGIAGSDHDTLLTSLIATASQTIEAFCGTLLSERTVEETIFQSETVTNLVLRFADVSELTSLTVDDQAATVADFHLLKRAGTLRRKDGASINAGTIVATYKSGPAAAADPVKQATVELVKAMFEGRDRQTGVRSESVPDVAEYSYSDGRENISANGVALPPNVALLLMPYVSRYSP